MRPYYNLKLVIPVLINIFRCVGVRYIEPLQKHAKKLFSIGILATCNLLLISSFIISKIMAKKNSKLKKIIIIASVVVVIIATVLANVLRKTDKRIGVQFAETKKGTIVQTVSASGKMRPVVEVKISAKVSGTIVALKVQEGDSVHKGDLLLRLDREKYLAMRDQSKSALKSSQASLWKAQADFNRSKQLFAQKLASEADLQSAEASLKLAESQVEQQTASLKEIEDDLSKTEIYSPMKGVVSQLNKEEGEMVLGASFQEDVIMVIADLRNMEAEVEVDENDVVSVNVGDPVKIEIDAFPDTTFKGEVTRIANSGSTQGLGTQDEITNFIVEIGVKERIPGLRPGMSATVDIEVEKHDDAVYVPIQCVAMRNPHQEKAQVPEKGKKKKKEKKAEAVADTLAPDTTKSKPEGDKKEEMVEVVFITSEGDTAKMVKVKTGIASDTDIEILEGLTEGQKIVSGPYRVLANQLKEGDALKEEKMKPGEGEHQESSGER